MGAGFAENYYGHNPALHMVLAFLSIATGLSPFFLSKYIFVVILRIFFVLAAYMIIEFILKDKKHIAYLSTLFFMASVRLFLMGVSRRFIAGIFILMAIYTLLRKTHGNHVIWTGMFFMFSTIVIIADHTLTYIFMFFLFFFQAMYILNKIPLVHKLLRVQLPNLIKEIVFYVLVWFFWNTFVSNILIAEDVTYLQKIFNSIADKPVVAATTIDPSVYINRVYENLAIGLSQMLFIGLAFFGFISLFLIWKKRGFNESGGFFFLYSILGFIGFCFGGALIFTKWIILSQVSLWLFALPLCILVGLATNMIRKLTRRRINPFFSLVILLIFLTGSLLLTVNPTVFDRGPREDIVLEFTSSKSEQLYKSAEWLSENQNTTNSVLGDTNVFDVYSGYFGFSVITEGYAKDFYSINNSIDIGGFVDRKYNFSYISHNLKEHTIEFVVVNADVFDYPSFLFGKPLSPVFKEKIDQSNLDKIYDNRRVQIYHNILNNFE